MSGTGLPILTYHALDRSGGVTSTDPSRFAESVDRLVSEGLSAVDLTDWIARGRPKTANSFAIVFDDGLRSILEGLEVIERHRIPISIFLVTDYIGRTNDWPGQPCEIPRSPMLDWSECVELARRGVHFGAHTRTHPRLDRLDPKAVGDELRGSRDQIESKLNRPCGLFAYPYGISSPPIRDQAARGFDAAFGTRLALADVASPLNDLHRIDAYYLRSPTMLDRLISGRLRSRLFVRRGLRAVRRLATVRS